MNMCKKKIPNVPLYLLFLANVVYALLHGVNWLFWVACILTGIVLVSDIVEGRKNAGKK